MKGAWMLEWEIPTISHIKMDSGPLQSDLERYAPFTLIGMYLLWQCQKDLDVVNMHIDDICYDLRQFKIFRLFRLIC